ncbi:MAG: trigger factor [Candidatus Krumholzibacteriota bacterium]|nr:trigger factor [Candidatus Krumholzibacteriota bacterium]
MENEDFKKGISIDVSQEEDCRKVIQVEVDPGLFRDEKEKALKGLTRKVSLPGFRKGKVPQSMVKVRFADEIHQEALKNILPMAYGHALTEKKLNPIGEPVFRDIKAEEDTPLSFRIEVETAPELEISDYRNIKVKAEKVKITEEDVDSVLHNLQERSAAYEKVERGAVNTDLVALDYLPLDESGQPDETKKVNDYPVQLGMGQLFPAFEEALAGKEPGQSGEVEIVYPDDFEPPQLAGKKISYRFTVKEVKEKRLPPLDDKFASTLDEKFKSLEELKTDIRGKLSEEKEKEARRKREEEAIDRIIDSHDFEIPGSMVERFKHELMEEDSRRRQMAGGSAEESEERKKEYEDLFDRIARRNIKRFFLIDYISRQEKISVGDEEMNKELERMAGESGKDLEEVKKIIPRGSENYKNLGNRLRERKVFEIILGESEDK